MPELAPWRTPLARALHRNRALVYARYFQLATLRPNGHPANRTVVFRGFQEPNQLKLIADRRSEKIGQIQHQPWTEACWYFPKTREQFRLLGTLKLVLSCDPDAQLAAARQQQWQDLSDAARLQFAWPHPKQTRAGSNSDSKAKSDFEPPLPDPLEPPDTFCLLLLSPVEVDHLELRGEPQNRCLYRAMDQTWVTEAVNP
ncbi:MAG: pyridoxamine 5'-phosphate oxidase family protein [Pegethrix bostrychoides GSE-TBD4-15B]|jgi:PPOX class probable FMN-dependent enzyme|uniref:Pyridoxamine 5'-phosphate oxidase family protein n=1 Tax=Pegethrix bostrychoides GSE-TBD4-15B TaxID=2839662 RepID=A0A951P9D9_9CYAN|nr:pyridoxamine 5'-phosphate oxidase family protein [Pegethrix bostrychoides GSE-TBD4-15B]